MRVLKLTIQYDGTAYVGWQRQPTGESIQGLLEHALERIEGRAVSVVGASRTDAGVHAIGQVARVRLAHGMETPTLGRALNAMLPPEVRVVAVSEVADDFHPRYDARSKTYRYRILNRLVPAPFEWRYSWHLPGRLADEAMGAAARSLEGQHDFAAFRSTGSSAKTTVRTLYEVRLRRRALCSCWADSDRSGEPAADEPLLIVEVRGDGFLRHMVRTIVGTLVEVGVGRRTVASVAEVLAGRDRSRAGPTAPARGLFLLRVDY